MAPLDFPKFLMRGENFDFGSGFKHCDAFEKERIQSINNYQHEGARCCYHAKTSTIIVG